jgi:hypothetical protein
MFTLTFIMPGVRSVLAIATPSRSTAIIVRSALRIAGFKVRMWRGGALVG